MKHKTGFKAFFNGDDSPVTRVYIHSAGFAEVYGHKPAEDEAEEHERLRRHVPDLVDAAMGHFSDVWDKCRHASVDDPSFIGDFAYVLAVMWGDKSRNEKVIDFFGFSGINEWPGNPDVSAWVMREGVYVSQERFGDIYVQNRKITCGDTLILLGREEQYRRKTSTLEEYVNIHPRLGIPQIETLVGVLYIPKFHATP